MVEYDLGWTISIELLSKLQILIIPCGGITSPFLLPGSMNKGIMTECC